MNHITPLLKAAKSIEAITPATISHLQNSLRRGMNADTGSSIVSLLSINHPIMTHCIIPIRDGR